MRHQNEMLVRKLEWLKRRQREILRNIRVLRGLGWHICKARLPAALLLLLFAAQASAPSFDDVLCSRMNDFASSYNQFGAQWKQGKFDARLAKQLSKQWRAIEVSGAWPQEK